MHLQNSWFRSYRKGTTTSDLQSLLLHPSRLHHLLQLRQTRSAIGTAFQCLLQHGQCIFAGSLREHGVNISLRNIEAIADNLAACGKALRRLGCPVDVSARDVFDSAAFDVEVEQTEGGFVAMLKPAGNKG